MKRVFLLLISLYFSVVMASEAETPHKISLRTANGSFTYTKLGGGVVSMFNPDFSWHYFVSEKHSLGFGIDAYISITEEQVSLWGIRGIYRYYYKGQGLPKHAISPFLSSTNVTRFAFYVGSEFKRYSYFLGSNPAKNSDFEQSGTFHTINLDTGMDYRLSKDFELNAELNYSLFSLASTDDRVVMNAIIIFAGGSYLW